MNATVPFMDTRPLVALCRLASKTKVSQQCRTPYYRSDIVHATVPILEVMPLVPFCRLSRLT